MAQAVSEGMSLQSKGDAHTHACPATSERSCVCITASSLPLEPFYFRQVPKCLAIVTALTRLAESESESESMSMPLHSRCLCWSCQLGPNLQVNAMAQLLAALNAVHAQTFPFANCRRRTRCELIQMRQALASAITHLVESAMQALIAYEAWQLRPQLLSLITHRLRKRKRLQSQQVTAFTEAAMGKCIPLCRRAIRQQHTRGRLSSLTQQAFTQQLAEELTVFTLMATRQGHACPRLKMLGMSVQKLVSSMGRLQAARAVVQGMGHLPELNTVNEEE